MRTPISIGPAVACPPSFARAGPSRKSRIQTIRWIPRYAVRKRLRTAFAGRTSVGRSVWPLRDRVFPIGVACSGARPLRAPRGRPDHAALRQAASGRAREQATPIGKTRSSLRALGPRRPRGFAADRRSANVEPSCISRALEVRAATCHRPGNAIRVRSYCSKENMQMRGTSRSGGTPCPARRRPAYFTYAGFSRRTRV